MALAAPQATRFALNRVQLRQGGEVVGTDGRQLLLHGGFHFPWREAVLVPAVQVFGCKELRSGAPVPVGRTERHVVVRAGPWSVFLPADTTSRYPDVDSAIPRHQPTTWKLTEEAATQLQHALPKGDTEDPEIRIELGPQVTVRTTGPAAAAIPVRPCTVVGKHQPFAVPVATLLRALQLGFREFRLVDGSTPVLCPDGNRRFVFMPVARIPAPPPAARQLPAPLAPLPTAARLPARTRAGLHWRPVRPGPPRRRSDDRHCRHSSSPARLVRRTPQIPANTFPWETPPNDFEVIGFGRSHLSARDRTATWARRSTTPVARSVCNVRTSRQMREVADATSGRQWRTPGESSGANASIRPQRANGLTKRERWQCDRLWISLDPKSAGCDQRTPGTTKSRRRRRSEFRWL